MKVPEINQIFWFDLLLTLSGTSTPVTGKVFTDFTVKYVKSSQTVLTTKVLQSSDFQEVGGGIYRIRFTAVEMDTAGIMAIVIDVSGANPIREFIDVSRVPRTKMVHKISDWDPEVAAETTHRSTTQQFTVNGTFYSIADKAVLYDQSLLNPKFFKRNEVAVKFSVIISNLNYDPAAGVVTFSMRKKDDVIKQRIAKISNAAATLDSVTNNGDGTFTIKVSYSFVSGNLDTIGEYHGEFKLVKSGITNFFPDEQQGFPINVIDDIS